MKQTAVEFLSENYRYVTWLINRDEITSAEADKMRSKYFEEAKEIEKQQIIDAWEDGQNSFPTRTPKQYYNETFKNK